MMTRTLTDANLAYRVSMADARDAWERETANATRIREAREKSACLLLARARAEGKRVAQIRRNGWRVMHAQDLQGLLDDIKLYQFRVSAYGRTRKSPESQANTVWNLRMLANEMRRRGYEMPESPYAERRVTVVSS